MPALCALARSLQDEACNLAFDSFLEIENYEVLPGSNRPGGSNANSLRPRCGNGDCPAAGGLRGGGDGALHRGADLGLDGGENLGDESLLGSLAAAAARNTSPGVRVSLSACLL